MFNVFPWSLLFTPTDHPEVKEDAGSIDDSRLTAKEHFVFTDPLGQLYHFSVEGNAIRDGTKLPAETSLSEIFSASVIIFLCVALP